MQCLNLNNKEVKAALDELTAVLGSENAAYYIISENNGYAIDYAPNGAQSKLFSDLLSYYNGDRAKAIQAKARTFTDSFRNWFGDWLGNRPAITINDNQSIDFLFDSNPEISKIGTKEEYQQYLETIFPNTIVRDVYWHGTDSDFSDGLNTAKRGKGSGAPETGGEMYFNKQPWASLQYISGVNRNVPDIEGFNNWVKLWWELKEALGNGRMETDDWKNEIIGPNTRQYSPNKRGLFDRDKGGTHGKYLSERKVRYGYENKSDKEFFEEVFDVKYGEETFAEWVDRKSKEFKNIWNNRSVKNGIFPAILNIKNPIIEENQNTYYEEQRGLFTKAKQNNNDAILSNKARNEFGSDVAIVFNPKDNVHFLGTKTDIQQFLEWKKSNNKTKVSKIVDENGEPLIVYHGTTEKNITEFNKELFGSRHDLKGFGFQKSAFFFSEDYSLARETYAVDPESIGNGYENLSFGKVYPCFLNMRNPKLYTQKGLQEVESIYGNYIKTEENLQDAFVNANSQIEEDTDGLLMTVKDFDQSDNVFDNISMVSVQKQYVVFEPNQIKSIDNEGAFSDKTNNIYHQAKSQRKKINNSAQLGETSTIANLLKEVYPELNVEYVDAIEGGYLGEIDINALKILIDRINQGADTLPHEYAHYYIAMFKNSPIVQEGFKQFGDEEKLVQAIGENTVDRGGKARKWYQKFFMWIKKTLNKNKYSQQALLEELTDAFLTRQQLSTFTTTDNTTKHQKKNKSISEVKDIIQAIQSKILFDSASHTYTNALTGEILKPVSKVKELLGYSTYDDANADDEQKTQNIQARERGTMIHAVLESMFNGTFDRAAFDNISDKAIDNIRKIHDKILQDYEIVAPEVMIADLDNNIAGTTDLLLRNKKTGKYTLADYKTKLYKLDGSRKKKNKKMLWGFQYVHSSTYSSKTSRDSYDFQLSAYQYMLQKLGIDIDDKFIVPILYEVNDDNITNVYISNKMGDDKTPDNGLYRIIESNATRFDVESRTFNDNSNTEVNLEQLKQLTQKFENFKVSMRKQLSQQAKLFKLQGRTNQSKQINEELSKLNNMTEIDMVMSYINLVQDQLKRLVNQIEKRYKDFENAEWNLQSLHSYYEIASSYSMISDISGLVHEFQSFFTQEQITKIDNACRVVLDIQSQIKHAYESKGFDLYVEAVSKNIINIQEEYRDKARKKYLEEHPNATNEEIVQYEEQYILDHRQQIDDETVKFLTEQRKVANEQFAVDGFTAQFSTVAQSKDPFVQTAFKMFYKTMLDADNKCFEWRNQLYSIMRRFYDKYGVGNFSNMKEIYGDMIEIIDGKSYLVSETPVSFTVASEKIHDEIFEDTNLTMAERRQKWNEWLDENCPISDKTSYANDFRRGLEIIQEDLSSKQKKAIDDNLRKPVGERMSWYYMYKKGLIENDTANKLQQLEQDLNQQYRFPDQTKWPNEKYQKLLQLKEQGDVKWEMYEFLVNTVNSGEVGIPNRLKLNNRLPGVRKKGFERIGEKGKAKGLFSGFRNKLKEISMVMEDEDQRSSDFVDINGKKLYQVNLFYTSDQITEEDQSYNLPIIFGMWYEQAVQYKAKKSIESYMTYTTHVLEQRLTESSSSSLLSSGTDKQKEKALVRSVGQYNQWNEFMNQVFYGDSEKDMGKIGKLDIAKTIKLFLKYYSNRTMIGNYVSMFNNAITGEINQLEEVFAGKYVSRKSYARATRYYLNPVNIASMLADIGKRRPENKVNILAEFFGVFRGSAADMRNSGMYKHSVTDIGYWTTSIGERELQHRFMLSMLMDREVHDSEGKSLGSLFDNLIIDKETTSVTINQDVADFSDNDLRDLQLNMHVILMEMHGNYNDRMKVAAQARWYGWFGLMMRKWVIPSIRRRFAKEYVDNITGQRKKGFYRSGIFYIGHNPITVGIVNFLGQLLNKTKWIELKAAKWNQMSDLERQNIIKFSTEITTIVLALIASTALASIAAGDDDDDDFLMFVNYQLYRLYNDLSFYSNPFAFARVMQDPFPSMDMLSNVSKLLSQVLNITEEYKYGNLAGENKFWYQFKNMMPGFRQIDRFKNIQDEMELFKNSF